MRRFEMRKVLVFDTTLRDGEQIPGARLNIAEKLMVAKQLSLLGVDYIEAGFSSSSQGDFNAVKAVAEKFAKEGPVITALARAVKNDIDAVYESVKYAANPMIHIVLGSSKVHLEKKFRKSENQVLDMAIESVSYAKKYMNEVQYSTEDASRSDFEYLWRTIEAVLKAGATIINVPDTVGYAVPGEFGELISKINYRMMNTDPNAVLSVHCHNDLGMATANTLAAVKNGASKVECTINGLGERAGNAALEEVVMGIVSRPGYFKAGTNINTREIKAASRMVSRLTGMDIQVNKAIVGDNAFAHSSGIHQDGLLKSRDVYEIIRPDDIGVPDMELILTARSGKHALEQTLAGMGFTGIDDKLAGMQEAFLDFADDRKEVYLHELYEMASKRLGDTGVRLYSLEDLQVISNSTMPSATVKIRYDGKIITESATGDGPIDAMYSAISKICGIDAVLDEYRINSITAGCDALGRARITMKAYDETFNSRATDTDIIKASALAYLNCINNIILWKGKGDMHGYMES
jgi:2-isopropylmalate synthase